ncbi:hypothetical protein [Neobacillus sp. NPDC093127]|uniref:hypothetical protein n=1 Tax=Neobacillus sp. NPDC093127 TaxID=3364296 RepID=UPI00381395CB
MSEWDFLWGLSGKELDDAMSSGMTKEDMPYIEEQVGKIGNKEWETLKTLRDSSQISKEEFKNRKIALFSK